MLRAYARTQALHFDVHVRSGNLLAVLRGAALRRRVRGAFCSVAINSVSVVRHPHLDPIGHPMSLIRSSSRAPSDATTPDYFAFGGRTSAVFARGDEAERIVRHLISGTTVEVLGSRWSGRTELLRRTHLELSTRELTVFAVRGVVGTAPYECVRLALPFSERRALSGRAAGLNASAIQDAYEHAMAGRTVVLMVDDADLLDAGSWSVVEGLHKSFGVPVLTAGLVRPLRSMPRQSVVRAAHPVVRVTLGPLSLEAMHSIVEHRLDGPVSPETVGRIHTKSAGLPGFALALVDAAVAGGTLRREHGMWLAPMNLWAEGAATAFEALLSSYDPALQDALELLSIVGVTDLSTAQGLVGTDTLEVLDGHGLVRLIEAADHARVAVNPPGIAEYFRNQEASARRLRLVEQATELLSSAHAEVELDYVREVWRRTDLEEGGLPLRTSMELPAVARMFTEDHQVHRRVAMREWSRTPAFRTGAGVLLAELTGAPDPQIVDEVVARTSGLTGDDDRAELLARYLRSRAVLAREGGCAEATAALGEGLRAGFAHAEAVDTLQRATRMEFHGIDAAETELLRGRVGSDLNGEVARLVLAVQLTMSGHGAEALEVLDGAGAELTGLLASHASILRGLALTVEGRHFEAAEWAIGHLEDAIAAIDRLRLAGHAFVAALNLIVFSRFDEAYELAGLPMRVGISTLPILFAPDRALLTLMSMLASYGGRRTAADGLLEAASALTPRSSGLPCAGPAWSAAVATHVDGDKEGAAARFEAIAVEAAGGGYAYTADFARLLSLLSVRDPAVEARLGSPVDAFGGGIFRAYLDARAAAEAGDAERVLQAAARLGELRATPAAVKYYAHAARLYREQGSLERSADARALIQELASTAGSATGATLLDQRSLTPREAEVARHISEGLTNGQIAAKLVVSIRTVESHINRIARKTGALDRSEIADLGRARPF